MTNKMYKTSDNLPINNQKKKERKTTITINIDKVRRHEIIETELFVDDVIIHHENLKQYTEKLRNNENI